MGLDKCSMSQARRQLDICDDATAEEVGREKSLEDFCRDYTNSKADRVNIYAAKIGSYILNSSPR